MEKVEREYNIFFKAKVAQVGKAFLPRKIALGSIIAVLSFIWAFPSVLQDNPLIGQYFVRGSEQDYYFAFFTMIWLFIVVALSGFLLITFKNENRTKNILHQFEDVNFQYDVFSSFLEKLKQYDVKTFTQKELEEFIYDNFFPKAKKNQDLKEKKLKGKYLYPLTSFQVYVKEILPKTSEMLILRAVEKGIIKKNDDISWYDRYLIINGNI